MFGKNPVRKQEFDPHGNLQVKEIFGTLQGEGPNAGESAVFVRLSGCNLRCWFCDTDFEGGEVMGPEALIEAVQREKHIEVPRSDLIVLTGGEPFRQNLIPFMRLAVRGGWRVQIETAGTLWIEGFEELCAMHMVRLVCSPKTPQVHPRVAEWCQHYKYIISARDHLDKQDGLPCATTQMQDEAQRRIAIATVARLYRPTSRRATIWVQPCDEYEPTPSHQGMRPVKEFNKANTKLCASLAMRHGYRVSLQVHKILGLR